MKTKISFHLNRFRNIFQDNLFQKIIKNSSIIFFGNSTASALSLISFIIMAKQIGPKSLAILVLAQTYSSIINDIFNIQTWESMVKFGSTKIKKNNDIYNIIHANFILDFFSAIVAFIFAVVMLQPTMRFLNWDATYINIFYLYSVSVLFRLTSFTIGIPRLFNRFASVAKIQVVMALLKLGSVLYAVSFANSLTSYIYINLAIDILTNLSLIIYSMRLLGIRYGNFWWKNRFQINKDQIRFIWWTNLRTIIRIPVRHFDMVVISAVISVHLVGIYKVYKEIAFFLDRVGEPINQSIFPEFTKLLGKNESIKAISVAKRTMFLLSIISILVSILLLISSNFIVETFFGKEYLSEINVLRTMIVLFGIGFVLIPVNSLFIAAGFAKYSFFLVLLSNAIYLIIVFALGARIGLYGVIIAYAVQIVINQGLKILFLKRYSDDIGTVVR